MLLYTYLPKIYGISGHHTSFSYLISVSKFAKADLSDSSSSSMPDYSRLPQQPPGAGGSSDGKDFLSVILGWFAFYFRPIIKGFLRLTTR